MKLEDQIVSLELARKLKELGVPQESVFLWVKSMFLWVKSIRGLEVADISDYYRTNPDELKGHEIICAAFTVAELISMLQELTKREIIIPVVGNVADHLAQEIIGEISKKKD